MNNGQLLIGITNTGDTSPSGHNRGFIRWSDDLYYYGGSADFSSNVNYNTDMQLVHVTWNGSTDLITFYKNGVQVANGTRTITQPTEIGVWFSGNTTQAGWQNKMDGILDEGRILSTELTSDWIAFEFCNQQNSFINGSTVECPAWFISEPGIIALPTAPTSLSANAVSISQINLSWVHNLNNNTNGFKIFRETPTGNGFSVLVANTTTTSTSFQDMGLTCNTEFNYMVAALNANGTGANSTAASDTTNACPINTLYLRVADHVQVWMLAQTGSHTMANGQFFNVGLQTGSTIEETRSLPVPYNLTITDITFDPVNTGNAPGDQQFILRKNGANTTCILIIANTSGAPPIHHACNPQIEYDLLDTFNFLFYDWGNGSAADGHRGFIVAGFKRND